MDGKELAQKVADFLTEHNVDIMRYGELVVGEAGDYYLIRDPEANEDCWEVREWKDR